MPKAVAEIAPPLTESPRRKRWTRAECAVLETSGVWEQQRLELVEGELYTKMGKNRRHVHFQALIHAWLVAAFGVRFVNGEAPVDVAPADNETNEPVPDLIVLAKDSGAFKTNPQPAELRLVVEISDSTLHHDLTVKARLYARAGVSEYWVVDVEGLRTIVHREPVGDAYASVLGYNESETVTPLGMPDAAFCLTRVLAG